MHDGPTRRPQTQTVEAANEQLRDMVMSNILIHITRDFPREHVVRTIFKGVRMY